MKDILMHSCVLPLFVTLTLISQKRQEPRLWILQGTMLIFHHQLHSCEGNITEK